MISGDPEDLFPKRTLEQEEQLDKVLSSIFLVNITREQNEYENETSNPIGSGDQ